MPTIRQKIIRYVTKSFPFYSGCGKFANNDLMQMLTGPSSESVWADVPGGEILVPLNEYTGRAVYYVGDLDPKITWLCSKIVKPGDTVIDAGAHLGIVTIWLSHLVGNTGKVHSFEPNPRLQVKLEEALARNNIQNVLLHKVALGKEEDELVLYVPDNNSLAGTLKLSRSYKNSAEHKVSVRPLSKVLSEEKITNINFMKIDVEDFEYELLLGGREIIDSIHPDAILFELHTQEGDLRNNEVIKFLLEHNYKLFSIPRCLIKMQLKYFDPNSKNNLASQNYLAIYNGANYQKIANSVNASI